MAESALVCKAWNEPALRILWRELDTMYPLLRLFSAFQPVMYSETKDSLLVGMTYYLFGAILDVEWTRFQHYARYVRLFEFDKYYYIGPAVGASVYFHLARRSNGLPLFPRLRYLSYSLSSPFDPEICLFIPSTLRSLSIFAQSHTEDNASRIALDSLFQLAYSQATGLEELILQNYHPAPKSLNAIEVCCRLRKVAIEGVENPQDSQSALKCSLIRSLSTLKNLSSLRIQSWDHLAHDGGPCDVFESLETLDLGGPLVRMAEHVESIHAPRLDTLQIEVQEDDTSTAGIYSTFFESVYSQFGASLRILCVDFSGIMLELDSNLAHVVFIEPLFGCRHLVDVQLLAVPLNISDDIIDTMAIAWPFLQSLMIVHHPDVAYGGATLDALASVAQNCPHLRTLMLPSMDILDTQSLTSYPILSHSLKFLIIGAWEDTNYAALAQIVDRMFPHIDASIHWIKGIAFPIGDGIVTPSEYNSIARTMHSMFPLDEQPVLRFEWLHGGATPKAFSLTLSMLQAARSQQTARLYLQST